MLGQTLHLKSSVFRILPNPTFYHWDRKYFRMQRLLKAYESEIAVLESTENQVGNLQELATTLLAPATAKPAQKRDGLVAAEDAIDRSRMRSCTMRLTNVPHI